MMKAYDIVLLPSKALHTAIIGSSRQFASYDTYFVVDEKRAYPHLSLFMLQMRQAELDTATARLTDLAMHYSPFRLDAAGFRQSHGYVEVVYERTAGLDKLQLDVVSLLHSLRSGIRPEDKSLMAVASGLRLENYKKYGYLYVGELFRPHVTLTRLKAEEALDLGGIAPPAVLSGLFTHLAVCRLGAHGSVAEVIGRFPLMRGDTSPTEG